MPSDLEGKNVIKSALVLDNGNYKVTVDRVFREKGLSNQEFNIPSSLVDTWFWKEQLFEYFQLNTHMTLSNQNKYTRL